MADQIVNVDLSAEDLRERLQQGKIYPAERVETALRELLHAGETHPAPRAGDGRDRLSARPGAGGRTSIGAASRPAGSERVMVCLSSRSPHAAALLRKAARIADRLGTPGTPSTCRRPARTRNRSTPPPSVMIHNSLKLARQLGGTSLVLQGGRSDQHDRGLRQRIRHHARRRGPDPAAMVSPLVRPVRFGPPGAVRSRASI